MHCAYESFFDFSHCSYRFPSPSLLVAYCSVYMNVVIFGKGGRKSSGSSFSFFCDFDTECDVERESVCAAGESAEFGSSVEICYICERDQTKVEDEG